MLLRKTGHGFPVRACSPELPAQSDRREPPLDIHEIEDRRGPIRTPEDQRPTLPREEAGALLDFELQHRLGSIRLPELPEFLGVGRCSLSGQPAFRTRAEGVHMIDRATE